METVKEDHLNLLIFLTHVFEQLPLINTIDSKALDELLPWQKILPTVRHVPRKTK